MNTITVNGKTYEAEGKDISVINGVVMVDGKPIGEKVSGVVEIKFDGDLASLRSDAAVTCKNVKGNVDAGGSVTALGDVGGNIDAGGSVSCSVANGQIKGGGSISVGHMNINA